MAKKNLLLLTNNMTSGAIPHQFIDLTPHLREQFDVYAGALLAGADDRIDDEVVSELVESGATPVRFEFDTAPFYVAAREFHQFLSDMDVVNTHLVRAGVFGRVFSTIAGVPLIVSTEQNVHKNYSVKQRIANGLTLPLADHIVSISRTVSESFSRWEDVLLSGTPQSVIHNSVDHEAVEINLDTPVPDEFRSSIETGKPVIGTVGRAVEQKNQIVLLDAIRSLRQEYPNIRLVIVGDGPLAETLHETATRYGIEDNVLITGWIGRTDVYSLINEFDVYAMPSAWEGLGVAVVEAMIAEKPILVSDIPIFHEILGDTALYAPPDDPGEWTEHIKRYLHEPPTATKLSRDARERALDRFSPEEIAKRYESAYADSP